VHFAEAETKDPDLQGQGQERTL